MTIDNLAANDRKASFQMDWLNTKVGTTEGHRSGDFWPKLLANPNQRIVRHRAADFDDLRQLVERHTQKRVSKSRSVAFDHAMEADDPARGFLAGLRYYFAGLKPNEPIRMAVVRPLLKRILENL